jgi:hypothetical protein
MTEKNNKYSLYQNVPQFNHVNISRIIIPKTVYIQIEINISKSLLFVENMLSTYFYWNKENKKDVGEIWHCLMYTRNVVVFKLNKHRCIQNLGSQSQ